MKLKNLIRYTLFWCGMPKSKNEHEGDVILAQSFGRNSFDEADMKVLNEKFDEFELDEKVLEWIRTKNFKPGKPNKKIAEGVMNFMQRHYIPAIVQWEVAAAFPSDWYEKNKKYITCIWPPAGNSYIDLHSVIIESLHAMKEKKLSNPIVATHKRQIVRVACVIKKLFGKFPFISEVQPKNFDKNSLKWETRNLLYWSLKEPFVRMCYIVKRYV
ncbi:MAG: hypothetical protein AB1333_01695 [Patescibacteria group bacterium]